MRGLIIQNLTSSPARSKSRRMSSRHSGHHHPSQQYQPHGYPPSSSSHQYPSRHHHHPAGPAMSAMMNGPPPGMSSMAPPEGFGPPPIDHTRPQLPTGAPVSEVTKKAKEKMDTVLGQLSSANENTWMLIGMSWQRQLLMPRCRVRTVWQSRSSLTGI
jgi:hypothetical protein